MNTKVLVGVLIVAAFTAAIYYQPSQNSQTQLKINADGKVVVDLYTESLCPDCLRFIRGSLKTAANTKDFWKICQLNIIPYGNARKAQNGSNWAFTCQHGANECLGNLIEACAIKKFDYYSKSLPFVLCLEDNTSDFVAQGKVCATKFGLDWNIINACVSGPQGNKIMYEYAVQTDNLNPPHGYVPWVVVNGKHSTTAENSILNNMVKYVCSIYTGSERIDACK